MQRLEDIRVGNAGYFGDPRQNGFGIGEIGFLIASGDLHIDRGGQSEVQNFGGDVAGQEGEGRTGKDRGQGRPQQRTVSLHRRGVAVEADRDVAVLGTDRAAGVVNLVDAAGGQAAVIDDAGDFAGQEFTHLLPDQNGQLSRILDPGTHLRPDMHIHLAGSHLGKEVPSKEWYQRQGGEGQAEERQDEAAGNLDDIL